MKAGSPLRIFTDLLLICCPIPSSCSHFCPAPERLSSDLSGPFLLAPSRQSSVLIGPVSVPDNKSPGLPWLSGFPGHAFRCCAGGSRAPCRGPITTEQPGSQGTGLCFQSRGNPLLPFPGKAVTLLQLLLLLPSQPLSLPCPPLPDPVVAARRPGHTSLHVSRSQELLLGVELLLQPRARGRGRNCRGCSQPHIPTMNSPSWPALV